MLEGTVLAVFSFAQSLLPKPIKDINIYISCDVLIVYTNNWLVFLNRKALQLPSHLIYLFQIKTCGWHINDRNQSTSRFLINIANALYQSCIRPLSCSITKTISVTRSVNSIDEVFIVVLKGCNISFQLYWEVWLSRFARVDHILNFDWKRIRDNLDNCQFLWPPTS